MSSFLSRSTTIARPPPIRVAVSNESTSRVRCSGPTTTRSTTTSRSCFLFFSSGIFRSEGEVARLRLGHADPVHRAGVVLAVGDVLFFVEIDHDRPAAAHPGGGLQRVDQSSPLLGPDHHPVDHHLEVVLLVLLERDLPI